MSLYSAVYMCLAWYLSPFLYQTPNGLCWNDCPTLPDLMKFPSKNGTINIIQRIGTHHTVFGIFLLNDKNGVIIAAIAQQRMGNAYQINQEVLMKWLQGQGRHPVSWKTLVDVLKSINLNVLAADIGDSLQVSRSLIFTVCLIPLCCAFTAT